MKTYLTRSIIAALAGLALVCSANALTLTIGDSSYLGYFDPTTPPGGAAGEVQGINILNDKPTGYVTPLSAIQNGEKDYNRQNSSLPGPFTEAVATGSFKQDNSNTSVNAGGSFLYVLAKYGNAGYVWYFPSGSPTSFTVPSTGGGNGLSHTSAFNSTPRVPDGGSTIALLGLGLALLAIVRRKLA